MQVNDDHTRRGGDAAIRRRWCCRLERGGRAARLQPGIVVVDQGLEGCAPRCPCDGLVQHPPLDEDGMVFRLIRMAKPAIRDYYRRWSLPISRRSVFKPGVRPTFRIARVTPALAAHWSHPSVDCYEHLSELSEETIANLTEAILTHRFRHLSMEDPIAFDVHARLCGGRHRLRAIARARRPVWLLLMEGLVVLAPVFRVLPSRTSATRS